MRKKWFDICSIMSAYYCVLLLREGGVTSAVIDFYYFYIGFGPVVFSLYTLFNFYRCGKHPFSYTGGRRAFFRSLKTRSYKTLCGHNLSARMPLSFLLLSFADIFPDPNGSIAAVYLHRDRPFYGSFFAACRPRILY